MKTSCFQKSKKKQTCKTERIFRNIFVAATEIVRNACHIPHPLFIFYHLDFALTTSWNTRRKKKSERKCQQLLIITKVGSVSNMYKLLNNTFPFSKKKCWNGFAPLHFRRFICGIPPWNDLLKSPCILKSANTLSSNDSERLTVRKCPLMEQLMSIKQWLDTIMLF